MLLRSRAYAALLLFFCFPACSDRGGGEAPSGAGGGTAIDAGASTTSSGGATSSSGGATSSSAGGAPPVGTGGAPSRGTGGDGDVPDAATPVDGSAPAPDGGNGVPDGAPPARHFQHPGVLVSRGQLDFVKAKIAAGQNPWSSEFAKVKAGKYARLPYTPEPIATMKCGNGTNPLDQGCTASRDDATAAYTMALAWYYTGDMRYAASATAILDAWATTLKEIVFDPAKVSTDDGQNNGPLQAAWLSENFPRSAEILRHTNSGWPESKALAFGKMMHDVFLPKIVDGWGYQANWNLSMANGMISIGVYDDDRALFDAGVARWRERVPLNLYQASDGALPLAPPGYTTQKLVALWYGQSDFTSRSGHTQETCRDFSHTQMGLASTIYAAETAGHQGVDLYGEQQSRIVSAYEYVAKYLNLHPSPTEQTITVDPAFCGGTIKPHDVPVWEIAYNQFVGRQGLEMPESKITRDRIRAVMGNYSTVTNLQIAWEALTHGDTGNAGYP